jgi:hypothetical protein
MSDDRDAFEVELSALRPRTVSPALRERIGRELARPPRPWRGIAAGLAAVILGVLTLALSLHRDEQPPTSAPPPASESEEAPPTLQAYRSALFRSPEELDALLEKHAASRRPADDRPLHAFDRSNLASLGER